MNGNHRVQIYLAVPFKQKDEAKALGAKFDPEKKLWYVPHGADITAYAKWLPIDAAEFILSGKLEHAARKSKQRQATNSSSDYKPVSTLPPLQLKPSESSDPPWEI